MMSLSLSPLSRRNRQTMMQDAQMNIDDARARVQEGREAGTMELSISLLFVCVRTSRLRQHQFLARHVNNLLSTLLIA